jgi:hypothetical protein
MPVKHINEERSEIIWNVLRKPYGNDSSTKIIVMKKMDMSQDRLKSKFHFGSGGRWEQPTEN